MEKTIAAPALLLPLLLMFAVSTCEAIHVVWETKTRHSFGGVQMLSSARARPTTIDFLGTGYRDLRRRRWAAAT